MIRLINTLAFLFLVNTVVAQTNDSYRFKWKIDKDEPLIYKTYMEVLSASDIKINIGDWFADEDSTDSKEVVDYLKKMNEAYSNVKTETKLTNEGNRVIDVVMYIEEEERVTEEDILKLDSIGADSAEIEQQLLRMMSTFSDGVRLRGSVYEDGGVHSFWVKTNQKNLVSLFFELPNKEVKVEDKWSLEINFIANDQNFDCDSSYKKNEVTFIELKDNDIAVLQYDLREYVIGDFNSPNIFGMGKSNEEKTIMDFYFKGICEFSISKGKWVSYEGVMGYKGSGALSSDSKTKFSLIEK